MSDVPYIADEMAPVTLQQVDDAESRMIDDNWLVRRFDNGATLRVRDNPRIVIMSTPGRQSSERIKAMFTKKSNA